MKVCKMGLESIWIDFAEGSVRMCGWTNYRIGNLSENTIEDLWNGEKAKCFRKSMLDGSYRFCTKHECPYFSNDNIEYVDYKELAYPKIVSLSYEEQCNYVCRFCREKLYVRKKDDDIKIAKVENEIKKFAGQLKQISTNGVGEVFCSSSIMRVLSEINDSQDVKIIIESNGSLFNERNWNKIKNLGIHNVKVIITVHSFQEDTYQFLSGTKLPIQNIINNLHFISCLRKQGIVNEFTIATVICERNFREMPEFVQYCLDEFDIDKIRLRFFYPYGVMDRQTEWFYDIRNPYHPYFEEFNKIMQNPIFQNEKVWKFQGEALSIQKESPYVLEQKNFLNISALFNMDFAEKKIKKYISENHLKMVALYGGGGGGRAYIKLLQSYGMNINTIFDTYEEEKETESYSIVHPTKERIEQYEMLIVTQEVFFEEIKRSLSRMNYQGRIERMGKFLSNL